MKNANPVSLAAKAAVVGVLLAAVCGCGADKAPEQAASTKSVFDHFPVMVGGKQTSLQLAVTDAEQSRGLMQRPDLGGSEGMIFVNTSPRPLTFWMHNTPEALDIGYISQDGVIAETYDLLPMDERIVASHRSDLQYALEMPKGWFTANSVHAGSQIDMAAVAAAMKARGFDPVRYGMKAVSP
ncbi:MAG TPA: DUF192 domain-containing protein [Opitutaceae bacterium]|nr:DUF192 domain-containing protein [Opitutaceae bacterium]